MAALMPSPPCAARRQPAGFSGRSSQPPFFPARAWQRQSLHLHLHSRLQRAASSAPQRGADGFVYLSPEAVERIERELAETREKGLQEYADLKALLLKRTWRFGTLFALYLLLTASAEAALCELLGAGASYGYLLLLFRDVDALQPGDRLPMVEAGEVQPQLAQNLAKWLASYRHALRPRLLVLVGVFAAIGAYNAAFPEDPLTLVEQGCLVGGFLAYKVALLQKIYDDLKPRARSAEELMQQPRPALVDVGEDVQFPWQAKKQQAEQAQQAEQQQEGTAEAGEGAGGQQK